MYKTKQKDEIKNIIKSLTKEFTIKDIYEKLNGEVGLTTIYRYVDILADDGNIKKIDDKHYQYLEECNELNHFYLKCDQCGTLIHVDCDCINNLSSHMFKEHGFTPNTRQIIINGICSKCRKD